MSYCGRHQPALKPCVRCLKVFSPEATPLPTPTPKLMESQLSLHEEMEALGSNIHNVPLISVGATEGGFLSLLGALVYRETPWPKVSGLGSKLEIDVVGVIFYTECQ